MCSCTTLQFLIYHNSLHLSDYRQFSDIGITQGSAATFIMRCEILIDDLITNLLASLSVKEF